MIEIKCIICGKKRFTYPSKIRLGGGKYCGRECCLVNTTIKPNIATQFKKGQKPASYKGWRYCGRNKNYREIHIGNHKYKREHILVMEQYLGRTLLSSEEIHHLDGNGLNNNLDNLLLVTKSEHLKIEHKIGRYNEHLARVHGKAGGA